MIVLAGADLVLPDRVLRRGALVLQAGRIEGIEAEGFETPAGATRIDWSGHTIAPGFIDVHVHGVDGVDVLDGADAIAAVAARLPRYGVTAFCPTSVACAPDALAVMLAATAAARQAPAPRSSRVLPAHLESNFINAEWRGAQPRACLRLPPPAGGAAATGEAGAFSGPDILAVIAADRRQAGIITLAPELPGGLDLVRAFAEAGHRVSIGHSGATYEQAVAAIAAGARHATHLFNRMSPMTSRAPGVVGAVLESDAVAAELICDGAHVHPALMATAIRTKGPGRIIAITDATAAAGLPAGSRARLGGQTIVVGARTAELEDGTVAGSVLTMDGAFRTLVQGLGLSMSDAARMCATTPAEAMGLAGQGAIAAGGVADLVVLGADLRVRQTYVASAPALEH